MVNIFMHNYSFCKDVAKMFELIYHKNEAAHMYNIGTHKERRGLDVAKDRHGLDVGITIHYMDNRPFNDQQYFLDDKKLKELNNVGGEVVKNTGLVPLQSLMGSFSKR